MGEEGRGEEKKEEEMRKGRGRGEGVGVEEETEKKHMKNIRCQRNSPHIPPRSMYLYMYAHTYTNTGTYIHVRTCTCNYKHTQLTHATHTLLPPSPSQNLFSPPLSDHALAQTAQCTAHTPSSWSASASSWITSRLLCSLSQCMATSGFDII